ncbi:hypothetical protein ACHQM5_004730 [Ranunculus cassubicifolius]
MALVITNNPSTAEVERVVSEEEDVGNSDIPIAKYSLQCRKCFKWRVIRSVREFEEIRGILIQNPFVCEMKPNMSCDVLDDIPLLSCLPKTLGKINKKRKSEGTTAEVKVKQTAKRKRKVVKSCVE